MMKYNNLGVTGTVSIYILLLIECTEILISANDRDMVIIIDGRTRGRTVFSYKEVCFMF